MDQDITSILWKINVLIRCLMEMWVEAMSLYPHQAYRGSVAPLDQSLPEVTAWQCSPSCAELGASSARDVFMFELMLHCFLGTSLLFFSLMEKCDHGPSLIVCMSGGSVSCGWFCSNGSGEYI